MQTQQKPTYGAAILAVLVAVMVVAFWLLLAKWNAAAAQWEQRGCTRNPHIMVLMYGEPEWYQFCVRD